MPTNLKYIKTKWWSNQFWKYTKKAKNRTLRIEQACHKFTFFIWRLPFDLCLLYSFVCVSHLNTTTFMKVYKKHKTLLDRTCQDHHILSYNTLLARQKLIWHPIKDLTECLSDIRHWACHVIPRDTLNKNIG